MFGQQKSGMQMMVESMLPPGFLDKLQTEFMPFIQSLDERLKRIEANQQAEQIAVSRIVSTCDAIYTQVENIMGKVDPSFAQQVPATLQHLLNDPECTGPFASAYDCPVHNPLNGGNSTDGNTTIGCDGEPV